MTVSDAYGTITIATDDQRLKCKTVIDIKLLKKAIKPLLKESKLIEFGIYPHTDGGHAVLMRDACSRDINSWIAVCPVVWEEQP